MKKVIISVAVSILIMLVLPILIVEIMKPGADANSTEPVAPTVSADLV